MNVAWLVSTYVQTLLPENVRIGGVFEVRHVLIGEVEPTREEIEAFLNAHLPFVEPLQSEVKGFTIDGELPF